MASLGALCVLEFTVAQRALRPQRLKRQKNKSADLIKHKLESVEKHRALIRGLCKKFKLPKPTEHKIGWQIEFEWEDLTISLPISPYGHCMSVATAGRYIKRCDQLWQFIDGGAKCADFD